MSDVKFIDGFFAKAPRQGAPDFVKGSVSIKIEDFAKWVGAYKKANPGEEWLNIDIKESRGGKWYASENTWKPAGSDKPFDDDVPW